MDHQTPKKSINPLAGIMRQPKIYVSLPSKGQYWPQGTFKINENQEYPIYSMTAKDELILKTPDALLNGQAVVNVLQSCVPNIIDAWHCPQIDIDALLIAIRIASYGEVMDTTVTVNGVDATYPVDLRSVLDALNSTVGWDERVEVSENLIIYVKPLNYKEVAKSAAQSFETQRIMNLVNDKNIDEDQKLELFKKSFNKLTEITLDIVNNSVYRIDSPAGSVTDPEFIRDFMQNCDRSIFNKVKDHLDSLREKNTVKPLKVKATDEMISAGAAEEVEVPIIFDPTTFFA